MWAACGCDAADDFGFLCQEGYATNYLPVYEGILMTFYRNVDNGPRNMITFW